MTRKLSGWGFSAVAVLALSAGFAAFVDGTAPIPPTTLPPPHVLLADGTAPIPPTTLPPPHALFADGTAPIPPTTLPPPHFLA